jgi:hypothetical protein
MDAHQADPPVAKASTVVEDRAEDGTLLLRSTMAGGVLHGPLEQFGAQGQPAMTAQFEHGKLHGPMSL